MSDRTPDTDAMSIRPDPPARLRGVADALAMSAAEAICQGKEAMPVIALVRFQPEAVDLLEVEMGDAEQREQLARDVRSAAHAFGADGVILLSEVWAAPQRTHDVPYQFGEIPTLPDREERLMVTLETVDGHWTGLAPITGAGLDRRVGELAFRPDRASGGRFTNLLSTPAQAAARADALVRLAAALRAAGLDPDGEGSDVKPLEHLHRVLVQNPAVEVDEAKIGTLVLTVQILQMAWGK